MTAVLRQLPTATRFLESYGDMDTKLAFRPAPPTAGSGPVGDRVRSRAGERAEYVIASGHDTRSRS